MHPSDGIRCSKSSLLKGKRIVLGITGSIAAVDSFEIARELIRHGADVTAVMSKAATELVTPWTMEFATGNEVITEIDGRAQHVSMFGSFPDRSDLLLIAPCTANTISKIALGIDDTPVTTMATVAVGTHTPVLVAPAMHLAMYTHPIIQKNVQTLKDLGVQLVGPHTDGKKARIASVEEIVESAIRVLGPCDLKGRKVLVIGGSSEEPIDGMRVITNQGTGETAITLAIAAFERGADVELWVGRTKVPVPSYINHRNFVRTEDLGEMARDVKHEIVLVPAALADFAPLPKKGKISSEQSELTLKLQSVPKILPLLGKKKSFLVGFKAEKDVSKEELVKRAKKRLRDHELDMMVANDLSNVSPGHTEVLIVHKSGEVVAVAGTKREAADAIFDEVLKGAQ